MTETPSSTTDPESEGTTSDNGPGPADETTGPPTGDEGAIAAERPSSDDETDSVLPQGTDLVDLSYKAAFGVLLLLGLFATFQAYTSATHAIDIWIAREYRPIFQAAFNVGVVLACGIGLSILLQRVS